MVALILSILFWLVGFIIILVGKRVNKLLLYLKFKLDKKAEKLAHEDNTASYQSTIGEQVVDVIPNEPIHLVLTIVGMVVMMFGFVSLGFWMK